MENEIMLLDAAGAELHRVIIEDWKERGPHDVADAPEVERAQKREALRKGETWLDARQASFNCQSGLVVGAKFRRVQDNHRVWSVFEGGGWKYRAQVCDTAAGS